MSRRPLFALAAIAFFAAMPAQAIRFAPEDLPARPIILVDGGTNGPTSAMSPVPEPGSWLTMVVGFGLLGLATRRRPRVSLYQR
jgi:hypothetical protein